ncbi:unnamed protein product, partial [Brenthis ino]
MYWVILWSLWAARLVRQPTVPVRVTGGWLRGDVAHDGSHKKYMAVPYATHPAKRFLVRILVLLFEMSSDYYYKCDSLYVGFCHILL